MTTAAEIIADALAEIGVIGATDTPEAEDYAFCLRKLNQILERWSNSRLAFPVLTEISIALTGAQTYTLGPATSTVRPLKIENATAVDVNGTEYPVTVITRAEWDAIPVKDVSGGPPDWVWYQASNTNGTVNVYPKASGYTLRLDCQTLLASFATTSVELALPEGYAQALTLSLAAEIAPAYARPVSQDTRRNLASVMAGIRSTNAEPVYLDVGFKEREYEIERGW